MTFQGTNQVVLWTDYSITALCSTSYPFLKIAGTGQRVQSMFCESI